MDARIAHDPVASASNARRVAYALYGFVPPSAMSGLLYIEERCIVCAEDFGLDRKVNSIACGHVFCRECLDNVDPRVCPVCREAFGEDDIECIGPWEEEPNLDQRAARSTAEPANDDHHDDWEWDPAALDHIHDEEHSWVPSDADREADMKAREELGLPQDEDEEGWNEREVSVAHSDVERERLSEDDRKLEWALLDSDYAEDTAAWEELGLRA